MVDLYGFSSTDVERIGRTVRTEESRAGGKFPGKNRKDWPITKSVSGGAIYYCKITGKTGYLYDVALYDSPTEPTALGTGQALPTMLHIGETIPNDIWFIASAITIQGMALN